MILPDRAVALAALVLALVVLAAPAAAHDLGVTRLSLDEVRPGRYTLAFRNPASTSLAMPLPVLPPRCTQVAPGSAAPGGEVRAEFDCGDTPLRADERLLLPWQRNGAVVVATWADGTAVSRFFPVRGAGIEVDLTELRASSGSAIAAARRYLRLGVEHILLGIDHLLFVLGLLLLVDGRWMLFKTITAFTLAHSITLALSTLGVIGVPMGAVEASIALSIVFVAVEILHARQGRKSTVTRRPWLVAFAFGLLHGLGFASALGALGLPRGEIPVALLSFNLGVEIGQLAFVAVTLTCLGMLAALGVRWPGWSRPIPAYAIGVVATVWFVDRSAALLLP